MSFTAIDLSTLPAPNVVEPLDYQTILSAMIADLQARDPGFTALVESDPAWKIIEVCAYREMLLRQRVNDAARAVMLSSAVSSDLDQLGALFGVTRKTIVPAKPDAIPPVDAVMESDHDFRYRITLALEGLSTAGPEGAYLFHTLKNEGVKHASVVGPPIVSPGNVLVTLLGTLGNGEADSDLINKVSASLNDQDVRPLTDAVTVQSAIILPYTIEATIYTFSGPDSSVVMAQAYESAQNFTQSRHKVGYDIPLSGIFAALHVPGVQHVKLTAPLADISVNYSQAAYCADITLTYGGTDE